MALYTGRLLMRGGNESDFNPDKMMPREWAVSTDKKIVRICIAPGICIRMATYDAFEEDMAKIEEILKECQSIQEAVIRINTEVSQNADAVAEYTAQAKSYMEAAQTSATNAKASENASKTSETNAKKSEENAKASENAASGSATIATNKASESTQSASEAANSSLLASRSETNANASAENAKNSEDNADYYSKLSKSYAIGDTGERLGEDADNSKYYSETAKSEADRAKSEADRAQGIVGGDYVTNSQIKEYSLIKDTGYELALSIDNSTYVMTIDLKNSEGDVLSTKSIDFPIESMVINATYKNGTITLTLQNGNTLDVDVSALVSGLVKDTFTIAGIDMKDNISASELKAALGLDKVTNVSTNDQVPTFTQASTRTNIASGEKLSVLFGKIMKWFADLKAVAFSGSYNDLSNQPEIPTIPTPVNNLLTTVAGNPLDAVQGKVLDDKITALDESLVVENNSLLTGDSNIQVLFNQHAVTLSIIMAKKTYPFKWSILCTLPENLRPTVTIPFTLWDNYASNSDGFAQAIAGLITTDGNVKIYNFYNGNKELAPHGSVSYIIN